MSSFAHFDGGSPRPSGMLPREALLQEALEALQQGDLWLSAPSGYGKTFLLRALVDAHPERDRCEIFTDPEAYLASIARLDDIEGSIAVIDIETRPSPVLIESLNAAFARFARRHHVLLAARLGSGVHLSKPLASGRATRWGAEKLAFSLAETRRLVASLGDRRGASATAVQLQNRSEGWPLGAALLARRQKGLTGAQNTPPALREHFTAQLRSTSAEIDPRRILIAALPERICAELYHALTGAHDFEALTSSGLDLEEIEGAPGWWRFGRLMRGHLLQSLKACGAEALEALHRSAARWHQGRSEWAAASAHALEGGDPNFAAEIINRGARHFVAHGQIRHALSWLRRLGPQEKNACHETWMFLVTALILAGDHQCAETELQALTASLSTTSQANSEAASSSMLAGYEIFNRALLQIFSSDDPQPSATLETVAADENLKSAPIFGEAQALAGLNRFLRGERASGQALLEEAAPHLMRTRSWYAYALSQARIAALETEAGDLSRAAQRCEQTQAAIVQDTRHRPPCLAPLDLAQARLSLLKDQPDETLARLGRSFQTFNDLLDPAPEALAHLLHAELLLQDNLTEEAAHSLEQAETVNSRRRSVEIEAELDRLWVRTLLRLGEMGRAAQRLAGWSADAPLVSLSASAPDLARLKRAGACADIMLARGQTARAQLLLQSALRWARRFNLRLLELEWRLRVLEAEQEAATWEEGDASWRKAVRAWRQETLQLGAPGLHRLAQSAPMRAQLHEEDAKQPVAPLRQVFHQPNGVDPALTEREREILALLALGQTNKQIAQSTATALTTVKWHVRNILSKLDAQNRATAISKARTLGLIA